MKSFLPQYTDKLGVDSAEIIGEQVKQVENADASLQNLNNQNADLLNTQEQVNQVVGESGSEFQNAGAGVKEYGDALEKVEGTGGGFFQGIKDGFREFAESVQSNSELAANFFADTLSAMSQNFSDLFFNIVKGRFENLGDIAKQTFDAILRSFLDLVAAIITKELVVKITGVFDSKGGLGTDPIGGILKGGLGFLGGLFKGGGGSNPVGNANGFIPPGGTTSDQFITSLPSTTPDTGFNFFSTENFGTGVTKFLTLGAPLIGAAIGFLADGAEGALKGGVTGLGALAGSFIGGPIGAAVGGLLSSIIFDGIAGLFDKKPRLDIDIGVIRDEVEKRGATVSEFLDDDLIDEIINISVQRKSGLGIGDNDKLKRIILDAIQGQIEEIQAIINKLPSDLAESLNDALLNSSVDIENFRGRDKLLEFDETKKISEKFQQFIEGDLQARFIFSIRDFFTGAFESLGVLSENAQSFVNEQFEEFQNLKGREARTAFGAEFLASFNAFVDAFNIVEGNVNDSISQTINSINSLSKSLGFEAVPSLEELRRELGELIKTADLDPETVQNYVELRNAIVGLTSEIVSSISGLIGKIGQLNSTITELGGASVDTTGFLNSAIGAVQNILSEGGENLSLSEQEGFLDQLGGLANELLAQERAVFEQAQQRAQRAAEARAESQRRAVQAQIDGLEREKDLISKNFDARIEALQKELQIAEEFARLNESILNTLNSIIFSPESVFTSIEQVGLVQSDITKLQGELAGTTDPARQVEIAGQLEEAFERLFGLAGDAFGVNSPEFVAIFDQVTGGLTDLADLTAAGSRSVEEINAEIESLNLERNQILEGIDARIDQAQERLAAIQTQNVQATFQASSNVRELFEFIRGEYIRILEERFAQLEEVQELAFGTEIGALNALVSVENESLVVLRSMESILSGATSFRKGSGGIVDFGSGSLAFLHGREAVVPESQITPIRSVDSGFGEMNVNVNVNVNGGSEGAVRTVSNDIENMLVRSIRQGGRLRSAIQDAGARRLN